MMMGTTIGEMSRAMTRLLAGKSARLSPMAAKVPRVLASTVVANATTMELRKERRQGPEEKSSSYHLKERPGSGKVRKEPAEKERGTMTSTGSTRNRRIATTIAQRTQCQMRCPVV